MADLEINAGVQETLDALQMPGTNLFVTGRAGTGKSTLLRYLVDSADLGPSVVLAPTGVAAINVGGETIHHFFRFGPGVTPRQAESAARTAARTQRRARMYRGLETMVIDEISMVRADLLDAVDAFLKTIRSSREPFGGVRLLAFGDLHQLPPVVQREEKELFSHQYPSPHFFDSQVITKLATDRQESMYETFKVVELEKIYRQTDKDFIDLLNGVRNRQLSLEQLDRINARAGQDSLPGAVHLTTTNASANAINADHLEALSGKSFVSVAKISEEFPRGHFPTEEVLELKPGARVMLLTNDSADRWVNGTLGSLSGVGEQDGVHVLRIRLDTGESVVVQRHVWQAIHNYWDQDKQRIEQEVAGSFTQFPVRLAWAMTIHKAQGKTFPAMVVDFGSGAFAHGQAYVALSRCTSLKGLVLRRPMRLSDVRSDPRVESFLGYVRNNL